MLAAIHTRRRLYTARRQRYRFKNYSGNNGPLAQSFITTSVIRNSCHFACRRIVARAFGTALVKRPLVMLCRQAEGKRLYRERPMLFVASQQLWVVARYRYQRALAKALLLPAKPRYRLRSRHIAHAERGDRHSQLGGVPVSASISPTPSGYPCARASLDPLQGDLPFGLKGDRLLCRTCRVRNEWEILKRRSDADR